MSIIMTQWVLVKCMIDPLTTAYKELTIAIPSIASKNKATATTTCERTISVCAGMLTSSIVAKAFIYITYEIEQQMYTGGH